MKITQLSKRKTANPEEWTVKAGNTKIGTLKATHSTPTQRTWSGSFSVPMADGTKVKVSVDDRHTAAQVNKEFLKQFKAGTHGKVGFKASEKCVTVRKAKVAE